MRLIAGERVDFVPLITETPESAVFYLLDENGNQALPPGTVANGALEVRRKGRVHPVFFAPMAPGKYGYRFTDGTQIESGHLRVQAAPAVAAADPSVTTRPGRRWSV